MAELSHVLADPLVQEAAPNGARFSLKTFTTIYFAIGFSLGLFLWPGIHAGRAQQFKVQDMAITAAVTDPAYRLQGWRAPTHNPRNTLAMASGSQSKSEALVDVTARNDEERAWYMGRRETLAAGTALGFALGMGERRANAEEFATFYGTAYPPANYAKYDPVQNQKNAVYTFDYPASWDIDQTSKVEKGTGGIDGRVVNKAVKGKKEAAFVITVSRAGEDGANFKLQDAQKTLSGFSIADPGLGEVLESADEVITTKRTVQGREVQDFEIKGSTLNYLVSVTVFSGKLFALFCRAPPSTFEADRAALKKMVESFRLTELGLSSA